MWWLIFLTALVADQLTKLIAPNYVEVVSNYGISFSWLDSVPSSIITLFLIVFAVWVALTLKEQWKHYPKISALFWAGVISNLLDRILFGQVSDWISLPMLDIKNNLADFYLSISLLLLLIQELKDYRRV